MIPYSRHLVLAVTTLLVVSSLCFAADNPICIPPPVPAAALPPQRGGTYMTSNGQVRVLVVFVQFDGDNADSNNVYWRSNQPPSCMNAFIDASPTQHSTSGNLTHFYRVMSFDRLILYGDPYFVKLHNSESFYRSAHLDDAFLYANQAALQQLHDEQHVNFASYDNWTFSPSGYDNHPGADGAVDMIIMYYRNLTYPHLTTGVAVITHDPLTLDGKT